MNKSDKPNILREWKKEYTLHSSELNPEKFCNRKDIERIEQVLLKYFGQKFFEIDLSKRTISKNEIHLIHYLLSQKSKTSLTSIFEYTHLIEYANKQEPHVSKKLKSNINNAEQFQNILFEIYTYRLLDYNKIENEKGTIKGNQELEGVCKINKREFIFECRKSYSISKKLVKDIHDIMDSLYQAMNKSIKGFEFIGYIKLKEVSGKTKEELRTIFKEYFSKAGKLGNNYLCQHECSHLKFEIKEHNTANLIEYNNLTEDKLIKVRCYIRKENAEHGMNYYATEIIPQFTMQKRNITKKLLKTIRKKREQHKKSNASNRIIFIDCEVNLNLSFPLLLTEKMIDEEKINNYLNSKDTDDIVVIILRNYLTAIPYIRLIPFGKEKFAAEMNVLKKLRYNFSFSMK